MAGKNSKGERWNLLAPDEATPLKLEQPNTTVVLSEEEAAWFSKQRAATTAARGVESRVAPEEDEQAST